MMVGNLLHLSVYLFVMYSAQPPHYERVGIVVVMCLAVWLTTHLTGLTYELPGCDSIVNGSMSLVTFGVFGVIFAFACCHFIQVIHSILATIFSPITLVWVGGIVLTHVFPSIASIRVGGIVYALAFLAVALTSIPPATILAELGNWLHFPALATSCCFHRSPPMWEHKSPTICPHQHLLRALDMTDDWAFMSDAIQVTLSSIIIP